VIVSHGRGGWFAFTMTSRKRWPTPAFVVAAINHTGDNGNDSSKRAHCPSGSRVRRMWFAARFHAERLERQSRHRSRQYGFLRFFFRRLYGLVLAGAKPRFRQVRTLLYEQDRRL